MSSLLRARSRHAASATLAVLLLVLAAAAAPLAAQDGMAGVMGKPSKTTRLGGHVGFVVPAIRNAQGSTDYFYDRFVFGFPVGFTVKPPTPFAIDFEFIPTFNSGDDFVLTIHPGIVFPFAKHYAIGVRGAYDAGTANDAYGLTPIISRGWSYSKRVGGFFEIAVPIRRQNPAVGDDFTSVTIAAHFGVTF